MSQTRKSNGERQRTGEWEERDLPVELTAEEIEARAEDLAKKTLRRNELRDEKAEHVSRYNSQIKELDEAIATLAEQVESGTETAIITCLEEIDEARMMIVLVRDDTGEAISERPMTAEERQGDLPIDEPEERPELHVV